VDETFAEIGTRFGHVDLLVNCAGRSMLRAFLDMSDDDLDWVLGPNLLGVVYTIRAAARLMPPGSRIVNVTSVSGRVPTPGEAFYSAAKAGVVSLSESLAAELATRGIGVTVALPGEMSTALFAEHASWELRPDFQRRMELPPEQVARAIMRAVRADRFEVVAPAYMRAVLLLQRLAPGLFRRGVGRYYARLVEPRIGTRSRSP
jgi:NAD(P)-dependent dehydrogenase (short-subunit alcohol dehydrogenase family)